MDNLVLEFQNFLSQIKSYGAFIFATFSKEPVAWLALIVSVVFGIANYRFRLANYRLATRKYLEEHEERSEKVFSGSMDKLEIYFDPENIEKYSEHWQPIYHNNTLGPEVWIKEVQRNYAFFPRYISARLHLSNQTTKPILLEEILFVLNYCEIGTGDCHPFVAKNLSAKELPSGKAQVLFFDRTSRKSILISEKNLLKLEPGVIEVIDAMIFIPLETEKYIALHHDSSQVYSVYVTGSATTNELVPIFGTSQLFVDMADIVMISNKRVAREKFSEIEKEYADWLRDSFQNEHRELLDHRSNGE